MSQKTHKSRKTADALIPGKPRRSPKVKDALADGPPPSVPAVIAAPPPVITPEDSKELASAKVNTGIMEETTSAKQWWVRSRDSSTFRVFQKIAILDATGLKDKDIAKKLKTTAANVSNVRYIAKKNGWLGDDGELIEIEEELALNIDRKIVRNISASLDGQMTNWQTHEMTLAAAKGRGHFKNHEVSKTEGSAVGMIGIQIIMPPIGSGDQQMEIPDSMMGGVPSYVESEVQDGVLALPVGAQAE